MSLIDAARDALKTLPITDVLRERLSLALDQSVEFQRQNSVLQSENAKIQAKLEIAQTNEKQAQLELATIQKLHEEHVRVFLGIEFKKGLRTGNQWLPFCPKCHIPLVIDDQQPDGQPGCTDTKCNWSSQVSNQRFLNYEPDKGS